MPENLSIDPDPSKNWIRRLSPLVFAHKTVFIIALLFTLLALLIQVAVPYVIMQAIDVSLNARQGFLMHFVWLLFLLAAGRALFVIIYRYFLFKTANLIEYNLRTSIFQHIMMLSFSFFDRIQSGQIISRANSDIRAVQMILIFGPFIFTQITAFFITLGVMFSIHVPLAFLAMLPLPLVYVVGVRMRRFMFPISWIVQARLADLATIVEENIAGVRVVKSFAAEHHQIGILASAAERLRWAAVRMVDVRAVYAPIMESLPRLATALVLLCGGYFIVNGQITVGALVAFSQYIIRLQFPFRMLGMLMMLVQRSSASAKRIFEILDEKPAISDRPGASEIIQLKGEIEFKHVTFAYRDGSEVLSDLSFKTTPNETVALVGRTGSGKTTVARLLTRFYDPAGGGIFIDGQNIRDIALESLRRNIGLVFDEPILFSISIRENIAYGVPNADFDKIQAAARTAGADEFIVKLSEGYETVIGERGYTLSGGQRQRLALARTLVTQPRILILDDATSSVDVGVELRILNALQKVMKKCSTLIIAHRLSTLRLADRILFLENGRITAQGTHEELYESEPGYVEVLADAEKRRGMRLFDHKPAASKVKHHDLGPDSLEQVFKGIS